MGSCASTPSFKDEGDTAHFAQRYVLSVESLGKGSTADVFAAESLHPKRTGGNKLVAVKRINKDDFDATQQKTILREASILHKLNSKGANEGIIKSYAFFNGSPDKAFLVLELIDGGDLYDRLNKRKGTYFEYDARALARNLLSSLVHLDRHGVAHRDLKMASLM